MRYKESNQFPGGLYIDYESDLSSMYIGERNAVTDEESFQQIRTRWRDLCLEMDGAATLADFLRIRDSVEEQDKLINSDHPQKAALMSHLVPPTLLRLNILAEKFIVNEGVVLLQLYNAEQVDELPGGEWRIKPPPKKEEKPVEPSSNP